jgi:hypothetical protein
MKFFEYFLRRHLRLRFFSNTFQRVKHMYSKPFSPYESFLGCVTIFSHDDVLGRTGCDSRDPISIQDADFLDGTELLTRSEPQPKRIFRDLFGWYS